VTRLVEDAKLREAFRRGDKEALAEIYDEYVKPIFALLRSGFSFASQDRRVVFIGLRSHAEIEVIVQEVFTRAFTERARLAYDGVRPYRNYLFTIARNLVADRARKSGLNLVPIEEQHHAKPHNDDHQEGLQAPDKNLDDTQLKKLVHDFISKLSAGERQVFALRFERGLTVNETARRLAKTEFYIKTTQNHLRRRFFVTMRQHGYFAGYNWAQDRLMRVRCISLLLMGGVAWRF
jgi:RNA polymerase sigma factor (sigma-70 family)